MAFCSAARQAPPRRRQAEDGYILLTLMLVVALMAIFTLAVTIPIKFAIQRDQEQEMIHRGVQYTRAIRAYYKKFGRYPTRLEDLDNTNNLRFLRKRYKDPLNKNQDFKLLHFGEPGVTLGGGLSIPGGTIPGANPIGSPNGLNGSSPGGSGFGSSGANSFGVSSSGVFSQSSGPGGSSNSGFGASSNSQTPSGPQGTNSASGSDPTQASSQARGTGQGDDSSSGQPLVTGGPIVGVASVSKKTTIREFNKKKKYNEWQFVYDPANDRGTLITTPNQPSLLGFGTQPGLNSTQPGSANGSPFGQPAGLNNNPNPVAPPAQPAANPPQQQ